MGKQGNTALVLLIALSLAGFIGLFAIKDVNDGGAYTSDSEIQRVSTKMDVLDDDTMVVQEKLYYQTGKINGIRRSYKYNGAQNEKIEIISVHVDGKESQPVSRANKGDRDVYTFKDNGTEQEVKIFNPSKGERMFTIEYRVRGGIKQYGDVQDLKWNMFDGRDGEKPHKLDATITFPMDISEDRAYVFGHGDVAGEIQVVDTNKVQVKIDRFYNDTFAEARVLLPNNPLTNVSNQSNELRLDEFLSYERAEAEKTEAKVIANGKRKRSNDYVILAHVILWGFVVSGLFFVFRLLYVRYDRETYKSLLEYCREIPGYSPAVCAKIQDSDGLTGQEQFIATIFSLYTKRVINLETLHKDVNIELLYSTAEVSRFGLESDEMFVYGWLADSFGESRQGTYKEFFNISKRTKHGSMLFEKNFVSFENMVLKTYRELDFEQHHGEGEKMPFILTVLGSVVALALVGTFFFVLNQKGDVLSAGSTMLVVFLFCLSYGLLEWYKNKAYRLTQEGARVRGEVRGLKQYINDYSLLKDADTNAVYLWEKYFVYGLALGVSKRALNQLYQAMPQAMRDSADWQTFYTMHYLSHHYNIVSRSQSAITSMAQVTGASVSRSSGGSSFGSGGGFSGGGGGGFGGGGSSSF